MSNKNLEAFRRWKWGVISFGVASLLWASGIAPSAYNVIISGSSTMPSRTVLKFTNGGCNDNPGTTPPETDCTIGGVLFSQTQTVTDAVQTTETTLVGTGSGSTGIPANFYGTGTTVKFEASGFYSTTGSPGTLTMQVKHSGGATGTVVVGTTGAITPISSVTNGVWRLWGNITFRTTGAAGTGIMNTVFELEPSSLSTLTPANASIVNTTTFTVDTTAIQTINLTSIWSAAGQSISCSNLIMYSPNGSSGGGGSGSGVTLAQLGVGLANLTDPNLATWAWFNQGSCTVTTNGATIALECPSSGGNNLQGRVTTIVGSSPYTVTLGIVGNIFHHDFQQCGIVISNASNYIVMRYPKDGEDLDIFTWTGTGTPGSNLFSVSNPAMPNPSWMVFERIKEDSTNRTYQISTDGLNYTIIFTEAKQTFITATQAGFFCLNNTAAGFNTGMTANHWTLSTP